MLNKQNTREAGLTYVLSTLSQKGWKYDIVKKGRVELYQIEKNEMKYVIYIKTLSKEAPVPFPQGLGILDGIDYLVICNNLREQPNLIVIEPNIVKQLIHKDMLNEIAYWLETCDYNRHDETPEQTFG